MLVIDDEESVVELLRILLELKGYEVIKAYRAEDGLALSSRNGYLSESERAEAPNGFGEYVRWLRAQSAPSAPTAWPAPPPTSPPAC